MHPSIEQILSFENLQSFDPPEVNRILGILFETGRENKDIHLITKGLQFSGIQVTDHFSANEKMIFYYFVANGWSYRQQLTQTLNSSQFWAFESTEIDNQIIYLRKALACTDSSTDSFMASQVLTNLGNIFDHVGRFSEATQYWLQALQLNPAFGMAFGNLGFGLAHYAKVLFDEGQRFLFCQFAYDYLLYAAASPDVYAEGQQAFSATAKIIEERYGEAALKEKISLNNFSMGKSREEKLYRQWCAVSTLYLNPLNDFLSDNIVAHDCLFLPVITLPLQEGPFIHSMFNQLKQEYVSARYLYYESLTAGTPHFSDKGNMQMDTGDYAAYSLSAEKLKIAFRVCYSLFDKIGYILNKYLAIGKDPGRVSFRNVWYNNSKNNKDPELHDIISNSQNWPLRGLFWISKDLVEKENDFSNAILPEARQLASIRNFMEHKSLKIVETGETGITDDGLTYQISRSDLEQKVYILMQMARSSIIYLSLAIHLEELKKEKREATRVPFKKLQQRDKR